jgi:glycyl-tRNA synthetase
LGPLGCSLQNNLLNEWRKHFVLKDHMLEIECSILTPEIVLQASGHLNKFSDIMVKQFKNIRLFYVESNLLLIYIKG